MNDIVFAVYYQGAHRKAYLTITTDWEKAVEVAKRNQGFPIEKWENGVIVDSWYRDFSPYGKDRINPA